LIELSAATAMSQVEFSIEGHVARVHLNRPEALNAITPEMDEALAKAWEQINASDTIRVALLTAECARAFCAGADISSGLPAGQAHAFGGGLTGIGGPLVSLRKPLVAAVRGHAVGGGFELAMCADVLLIDETASFRLPEVGRGFIAHSGVLHRAVRKLPLNVAIDLILTGRPLGAREAHGLGLVSRLLAPDELMPAALEVCEVIANSPPLAVLAAREAVRQSLNLPLEVALGRTYPAIERFQDSQDAQEAVAALQERRRPRWSGR